MGYVPPVAPTAAELIRKDLEPTLMPLYNIFEIGYNRDAAFPLPGGRGYKKYVEDLYGPPKRDWFPVWNYGLLASLFALPIAILWAIFG